MCLENFDVESNDFDFLPRLLDFGLLLVFGEEALDLVEFAITKVEWMLLWAVVRRKDVELLGVMLLSLTLSHLLKFLFRVHDGLRGLCLALSRTPRLGVITTGDTRLLKQLGVILEQRLRLHVDHLIETCEIWVGSIMVQSLVITDHGGVMRIKRAHLEY
jgi:hypothetical protein